MKYFSIQSAVPVWTSALHLASAAAASGESVVMPGQTHLIFRHFCLFWLSTPLRGVCLCGEAGKSGIPRDTALRRL